MQQVQPPFLTFNRTATHRLLRLAEMENDQPSPYSDADEATIPPRRQQVLSLYVSGYSREQIGEQMGLSPHTVRNHIRLVYDQLGVSNRIEALRWALTQPDMSHEVLYQLFGSRAEDRERSRSNTGRQPESLKQNIDEAITFFQRKAIESPIENI